MPETGRIFYEGAFANFEMHPAVEVDYANPDRAPLLITAGENGSHRPAVDRQVGLREVREAYDGAYRLRRVPGQVASADGRTGMGGGRGVRRLVARECPAARSGPESRRGCRPARMNFVNLHLVALGARFKPRAPAIRTPKTPVSAVQVRLSPP